MDVYDPTAVENEDAEDTFGREVRRLWVTFLCKKLHAAESQLRHLMQGYEQLREYIIFLVEASFSMQQPAHGELPQVPEEFSKFRRSNSIQLHGLQWDVLCLRSTRAKPGFRLPS